MVHRILKFCILSTLLLWGNLAGAQLLNDNVQQPQSDDMNNQNYITLKPSQAHKLSLINAQHDSSVQTGNDSPVDETSKPSKWHTYFALKSNVLYDLLMVPNIGIEINLGRRFTIGTNWMYAWWKKDNLHRYWRIYGGEVDFRKYFGGKKEKNPLNGHHLGVYGQLVTYDFELGGKGYLGERWSWGVGAGYGYSAPIAKHLNIDFSIGVGYLGGTYKEYIPANGRYEWQATKKRAYWGPTKVEIALVWSVGNTKR